MSERATLGIDLLDRARARRRSALCGKRIFYVDDEFLMRRAVARLLRGAGAICFAAGTHEQALVLLALGLSILTKRHVEDGFRTSAAFKGSARRSLALLLAVLLPVGLTTVWLWAHPPAPAVRADAAHRVARRQSRHRR